MAALFITIYSIAAHLSSITVTETTGVSVFRKFKAVGVFLSFVHASITGHAAVSLDWVSTVDWGTAPLLTEDGAVVTRALSAGVREVRP